MKNAILKNVHVDNNNFEYILFNRKTKEQTRFIDTPEIAKEISTQFNLEKISPAEALFQGLFSYTNIELSNF